MQEPRLPAPHRVQREAIHQIRDPILKAIPGRRVAGDLHPTQPASAVAAAREAGLYPLSARNDHRRRARGDTEESRGISPPCPPDTRSPGNLRRAMDTPAP